MTQNYLGEVRPFGGNFAPFGWALCDGTLLSIANNNALFALLGTNYGGDGVTTFALPDLRGRALIHQGNGAGLSPYVIGEQIGVETVTLTTGQMPAHPHSFNGTATAANGPTPGNTVVLGATATGFPIYDGTATAVTLSPQEVGLAGGSLPHQNRQPYLAITYIIALEGIFPSRN